MAFFLLLPPVNLVDGISDIYFFLWLVPGGALPDYQIHRYPGLYQDLIVILFVCYANTNRAAINIGSRGQRKIILGMIQRMPKKQRIQIVQILFVCIVCAPHRRIVHCMSHIVLRVCQAEAEIV